MRFLLDVNVLIALVDPAHIHHDLASRWFHQEGRRSWATCPLTENGVMRIVGHPRYGDVAGTPAVVAKILSQLRDVRGHEFWPDDISLLDRRLIDASRLLNASHLTDTYLLALAASKGGQLATLDRRLVTSAVREGVAALRYIAPEV